MKSAIAALLAFIAVSLLGFTNTNLQAQTGSSRSFVRLLEGESFTSYIEELRKTRSR